MPLRSLLVNQIHVLEGEHRSVAAISSPGYGANVANALMIITLAIVLTPAIRERLANMRGHMTRICDLAHAPLSGLPQLEAARRDAHLCIDLLRLALADACPSVNMQLALMDR